MKGICHLSTNLPKFPRKGPIKSILSRERALATYLGELQGVADLDDRIRFAMEAQMDIDNLKRWLFIRDKKMCVYLYLDNPSRGHWHDTHSHLSRDRVIEKTLMGIQFENTFSIFDDSIWEKIQRHLKKPVLKNDIQISSTGSNSSSLGRNKPWTVID